MTVFRSTQLSDVQDFVARDLCDLPPLTALDTLQEVDILKQVFHVIKSCQNDIEELANQMHELSKATLEKLAEKRTAHNGKCRWQS